MPANGGFEHSLGRLEAIVKELESAELPLERSVQLFEEGMKLVEECRQQLDAAEGKVEMLVKRAGEATAAPFSLHDNGSAEES
ncbi:MAG: exodeoxyribonuclease VII small subunit [Acidobacteria bacterium]|nr:MAG: exodeoxyribonuclease VII small subunit [Acidobacteriota bacterium]